MNNKKNFSSLLIAFLLLTNNIQPVFSDTSINYEVQAENYTKQKEYDLAIESYLKAIKDNPNNTALKYFLAKTYYLKEDYNKATKSLEEYLILEPSKEEYVSQLIQKIKEEAVKPDVDIDIPKTGIENKYGVAVVIGNQKYQNKDIPAVEYASNDARVFKAYLQNVLGYKEDNIIYLENATYTDFLKIFGAKDKDNSKLSNYIKEGKSDVVVYYSGHGAPDTNTKSAYLVPVDADPSQIDTLGYSLDTFYNNLNKLKAKSVTVILDSCFSGGSEKGMIIKDASPVFIKTSQINVGKINVLASSDNDQISSWYPDKKHSMFTYYLLKGLKFGNKPDNEDGEIPSKNGKLSLEELHSYVSEKVKYMARKLYSRVQTPTIKINGQKELIIE